MNNFIYKNFNGEIITYPFHHSRYKLLEEKFCQELIECLEKNQKLFEYYTNGRKIIKMYGDSKGLKQKSRILVEKMPEPLKSFLKEWSVNIPRMLYMKYNREDKIFQFTLMICLDTLNYSIGPHTDRKRRNCTLITYLNKTLENSGVKFYHDKINRHKNQWNSKHYNFKDFEEISQVENFPGSTVDFKVSKNSFHGVEPVKGNIKRYSLQMYILNKGLSS